MTHFEEIFCSDCNQKATMHADGSVACSCSFVNDPDTDAIPAGWKLCDGTSRTPDLRNLFIVGAGLTYAQGTSTM